MNRVLYFPFMHFIMNKFLFILFVLYNTIITQSDLFNFSFSTRLSHILKKDKARFFLCNINVANQGLISRKTPNINISFIKNFLKLIIGASNSPVQRVLHVFFFKNI